MKKTFTLFCLILFSTFQFTAQIDCYTAKHKPNIEEKIAVKQFEAEVKNLNSKLSVSTATYIIPVVFHVFHGGGSENISTAQILDQIKILNDEFQRKQADTVLTPLAFKPFASGINIEFRLATLDPFGNCTNGINRIYTTMANCGDPEKLKELSAWPSNKYFNIWSAKNFIVVDTATSSSCATFAYATFPWNSASLQGIILPHNFIGGVGTGSFGKGRIAVHETGHFLSLRHIWGDTICGNDSVADTPPANFHHISCPSFPNNPNSACGSNSLGEMYNNYMDYTPEACINMFTTGQVTRMLAALNSTIGSRSNLWAPANLSVTGTNDPYIYPSGCAAMPEISPYVPIIICAGDSVQLTDVSYNGITTSRLWNFFGNPSSSLTQPSVWVKYNTPGTYNVQLTINSSTSSKNKLFLGKIIVLNKQNTFNLPYTNSFETVQDITQWQKTNFDNDTTWRIFNNVAATGSKAMGINNFYNGYPLVDELVSPKFDCSAYTNVAFKFKVHYTKRHNYNTDQLRLLMSSDCGLSWFIAYVKSANTLRTSTVNQVAYHLPISGEWREDSVNLNVDNTFSDVYFKFLFTSNSGNNLFIDDINITGSNILSVPKRSIITDVTIYPNPSNDLLNIKYNTPGVSISEIELIDLNGKLIISEKVDPNKADRVISVKNLIEGFYILRLKSNGLILVSKKISVTN